MSMRTMTVRLPFGEMSVWVCNVCGETHPWEFSHQESKLEMPDVIIGDETFIISPYGSTTVRNRCVIRRLFYAKQGERFPYAYHRQPRFHELCVELTEMWGRGGDTRAWMTYADFQLRRCGAVEAMQEAGLLPKLKPPRTRFWRRMFGR